MASQIKGKIQAISSKGDGIKVNDFWYNLTPNMQRLPLKVGQEVWITTEEDNKTVHYINFTENPTVKRETVFKDEETLTELGRHLAEIWKLLQKL